MPPCLLPLALVAALSGCADPGERPISRGVSVAAALSGDPAGDEAYARATEPRLFSFPRDHGPHRSFRTEWWYFTGNLETPEGERVGYQLTFFRNALAPPAPGPEGVAPGDRPSAWATRQGWLAHFALTDAARGAFHADDRLVRGGRVGLAGAAVDGTGFAVHVADWSARPAPVGDPPNAGGPDADLAPVRLTAAQPEGAIDLVLRPTKPPVLHGERGLSHKGGDPGNASYYYSSTRLRTTGTVRLAGRKMPVSGLSWLDREWSTSALAPDQVGWDWFALQLDDDRELMVYLLRRAAGPGPSIDRASSGTLVAADGDARHLERDEMAIDVLDRWRSPTSGAVYPSAWRLEVPEAGLDLEIRPVLADQELEVGFRYWEGAVDVRGTGDGRPVHGRGYVELTGYADGAGLRGE